MPSNAIYCLKLLGSLSTDPNFGISALNILRHCWPDGIGMHHHSFSILLHFLGPRRLTSTYALASALGKRVIGISSMGGSFLPDTHMPLYERCLSCHRAMVPFHNMPCHIDIDGFCHNLALGAAMVSCTCNCTALRSWLHWPSSFGGHFSSIPVPCMCGCLPKNGCKKVLEEQHNTSSFLQPPLPILQQVCPPACLSIFVFFCASFHAYDLLIYFFCAANSVLFRSYVTHLSLHGISVQGSMCRVWFFITSDLKCIFWDFSRRFLTPTLGICPPPFLQTCPHANGCSSFFSFRIAYTRPPLHTT